MKNKKSISMSVKPHCANLTKCGFDYSRLRGFRLFAVVIETSRGAIVHGVYESPRLARDEVRLLANPPPCSLGLKYRACVLPLEIPRHYFK